MSNKMSQEQFIERLNKVDPTVEVLSEYAGGRKHIKCRCKICGNEREVSARVLLEGHRCIFCVAANRASARRKSHEQWLSELELVNSNIEVLSQYETNQSLIKCKCKIDGYVWTTKAGILTAGHGCPECGRKNNKIASGHRRTQNEFVSEIQSKFNNIIVMSQFHGTGRKVKFQCKVCGYEWDARPNSILLSKGCGCPKCANKVPVTEDEFINRLIEKNPYVTYVGGYTKMAMKANFRCIKCGYEWSATPSNVLAGKACPHCKQSHGVKVIYDYLNKRGIFYIPEHSFQDCKDKKTLPFDVYIPEYNLVCEYDGEQHTAPVKFGSYSMDVAQEKYDLVQIHDAIKTKYCEDNNITLVRILYTEFDQIETILDKHIS